nr:PaaI family thioesterase [Pacificimonas pallii]
MKPVIDQFMKFIPHIRELGIGYSGVGRDWAELSLPWQEKLVAYPAPDGEKGVIASGAVFTLMDSVGGFSVQAARKIPAPVATVDLRLDYLRPANPGETVYGYSKVHKLTRSIAFVRGYAHDGEREDPIALMAGCFMLTSGSKS